MKDFKIYIFIASLLLVIYLVAEYKRPKPIDWTASFSRTDKIPFGTKITFERLQDMFPDASVQTTREPVYNVTDGKHTGITYIIICQYQQMSEYDYQKLTEFIKQGNDVFIAASDFGEHLGKSLNIETDYNGDWLKKADSIHFVNKQLGTQTYILDKEIRHDFF